MPAGELFINGQDAYNTWGLSLEDEGLSRLVTPRPHKQPVVNKNVTANGAAVVVGTGYTDERTLSIPMHITAPDKTTFWARYNAFCQNVLNGTQPITLRSVYKNETFSLYYQDVQNFTEFMQEMAKFDVIFYESND